MVHPHHQLEVAVESSHVSILIIKSMKYYIVENANLLGPSSSSSSSSSSKGNGHRVRQAIRSIIRKPSSPGSGWYNVQ